MRDPVIYRILHAHHHRTGDKWCIYPMYDYAHGQSDSIEGITHSICTLEFENHRPLYDWFLDAARRPPSPADRVRPPQPDLHGHEQAQAARAGRAGRVSGWDDPRMPTICGLRRRGYTPEAIRNFCDAHRRRQGRQHRRHRPARALRPRGPEPDARRGSWPCCARSRWSSTTTPRTRSRSSTPSTTPRTPPPARARSRSRASLYIEQDDFHGGPAQEVLPPVARAARSGCATPTSSSARASSRTRDRRGRRASLHLRPGHPRRRHPAGRPQGQGHAPLGLGRRTRSTPRSASTTTSSRVRDPATVAEGDDWTGHPQPRLARGRSPAPGSSRAWPPPAREPLPVRAAGLLLRRRRDSRPGTPGLQPHRDPARRLGQARPGRPRGRLTRRPGEGERTATRMDKDVLHGPTLLTEDDLYLFNEGSHFASTTSSAPTLWPSTAATARSSPSGPPTPSAVSVIGDFNGWDPARHPLAARVGRLRHLGGLHPRRRPRRRLQVSTSPPAIDGYRGRQGRPLRASREAPPRTASIVWDLDYALGRPGVDGRPRRRATPSTPPISIYEVHLGSWRARPGGGQPLPDLPRAGRPLWPTTSRDMGFTHVELLPVMEHPFYGSWGYQTTGYFAPTSRYGTPQDFMYLVDTCTSTASASSSTGCPSHFPTDEPRPGLLRRHPPLRARRPAPGLPPGLEERHLQLRPQRGPRLPDLATPCSGSTSYHVDGLRVDAVASMLYLDYSRKAGRVDPQPATAAARTSRPSPSSAPFNEAVYGAYPGVQTIAEESTAWPMVSRPDLRRRPGLRPQVGHGLDARHAGATSPRTRSTASTTTTS